MTGKVLTVPHRNVVIQASHIRGGEDDPSEAHTYAAFRTEACADQKFGIYCRKESSLRPALLTRSRLELFEEEFGGTYVVSGNDISFVERALTPEIRSKLLELEGAHLRVQFGRPHTALNWSRERGWLTVSSYMSAGVADADYDRVIETALLFHESLEKLNRH